MVKRKYFFMKTKFAFSFVSVIYGEIFDLMTQNKHKHA